MAHFLKKYEDTNFDFLKYVNVSIERLDTRSKVRKKSLHKNDVD